MTEYRNILKDSGLFAIGSLGSKVITFLFVPLYTYCLSTSEYGTADLITVTSSLLFPVLTLSISEAVLRFCYQKETNKEDIFNVLLKFNINATIINVAISLIVSCFIPDIKPYLVYYIAIFSLTSLEGGLANYLKGCEKIKQFAIQGIVHTIILVGSNLLFLLVFNLGLSGYLISMILASFVTIIYIYVTCSLNKYSINLTLPKTLVSEMLRYSLPLVPAGMAWWINISADKFMITSMIGVADNGIYSVAHKIPSLLTTITAFFTSAWQISAMKNIGKSNYNELFTNVFKSVNCTLEIGCAMVIVVCQLLSKILFQNDYYVAWECVPLLTLSACFSVIAGTLASAYTASKSTKILFVSTCMGAIVNIVANIFLIKLLGIIGAAISTCLSFFVMIIIRYVIMNRVLLKLDINLWKDIIAFSILFFESLFVVYYQNYFYHITTISLIIVLLINAKFVVKLLKKIRTI